MAAEEEVEPVEEEPAAEEAPSKLDQALGSMRANKVAIDDEFSRPAEVTDAEIDAMVRSVIVGPSKVTTPAAAESAPQASAPGDEAEVAFDESDVAPIEAFAAGDEADKADEAPEWRSSKRWIWVVILLALAAVVFFVVSRAQGGEPD